MASILDPVLDCSDEELAKYIKENDFGDMPVEALRAEIDDMLAREAAAEVAVGETAPDFSARLLAANGDLTDEDFQLASTRGKVVGLMFGSYTCPIFYAHAVRQQEIAEELGDRAKFLCVYTREAHPVDGWHDEGNEREGIMVYDHRSLEERAAAAKAYIERSSFNVPMVVDSMDDRVTSLYNGCPERLLVIDSDGVVVFNSPIPPFEDEDVEDWYRALKQQLM